MTDTSIKLEKGEYFLDDPEILHHMMLAQDVKHPKSAAILCTRSAEITSHLIEQLKYHQIKTIFAIPIAVENLNKTAQAMEQLLNFLERILAKPGISMDAAVIQFQQLAELQKLENLIRQNFNAIIHQFNSHIADTLIDLNNHHPNSAHHSVISGFNAMSIGRELGWNDQKILEVSLAVMFHDIGKIGIKLMTLNWPGSLNLEQWQEIQLHTFVGGKLLYQGVCSNAVLVALTHHEWFAWRPNKGYGALTQFRQLVQEELGLSMDKIFSTISPGQLAILHIAAIADMVAALEEIRSYKGQLLPVKVLVIMNADAKQGHFNPDIFRAWHAFYNRKHVVLLPLGLQVALPREKEIKWFVETPPIQLGKPILFLSIDEIEKLALLPYLQKKQVDIDQLRRQGGMPLQKLQQLTKNSDPQIDLSHAALAKLGIQPEKNQVIEQQQCIRLEVTEKFLTYEELQTANLLAKLKIWKFDLSLIKKEKGILLHRLEKRGFSVPYDKLARLGIEVYKKRWIHLPAYEQRLLLADLSEFGITMDKLTAKRLVIPPQEPKPFFRLDYLRQKGFAISDQELAKLRIKTEYKIYYDIRVVRSIDRMRAEFMFIREGDTLQEMEKRAAKNELDPLQEFLFNQIGPVEIDFSDVLEIPAMTGIVMGDHWLGGSVADPD
ncbi:MAG: hypothetical protein H7832_04070 [Magnetococcus sp. DMHC-6]